ncbi:hypothetical protein ACQPZJ_16820 [Actinoplanes sp. CA-054009]
MTESERERQAIADQLSSLSLPELVDVLRRVLPAHADNAGEPPSRLVLAEATVFGSGPLDPADPPVVLSMVAWPEGAMGPVPHLLECGSCPRCGIEVVSNVKRAFCPACGKLCHLT